MRLETCIRKGLGLKAHRVKEVREEEEGPLVAEVERIAGRSLRCGCCGGPARQIHSRQKERQWRDLSVRDRPLVLRYAPVRVFCRRCGVKVEQIPWASRWQRVTRALALAIARLARDLSWKQTARHFGVDWKTVVAAVRVAVVTGLLCRRWKPLHTIGIDEVSRSKGQRYLTLVYDLRRGWALPYLKHWLWWASHSRLESFKRFAKMIRTHLDGILAWTRLRVSNGALEGMNNKVKAVSHRAFGFRKPESYITAIWHCCGDLPLE